jgi:hypothetical protein
MTKPRDPEALLTAYLAGGMEVLPDRVADAVLDEIHRTRQRAVFGSWRTRSMFKPSLAAAAVVAVLVSGALLMSRPSPPAIGGPSPTPTERPSQSQHAVVGPSATPTATPSPTPSPLLWTQASLEEDWPAPVRPEPVGGAIVIPQVGEHLSETFADPSGDAGSTAYPWVDIQALRGTYTRVLIDLASRDLPRLVLPNEQWIAYGVVVDDDRDGIADRRFGIDNIPGTASGQREHRAWITDLHTGRTVAAVGPPYGMVGDTYWDTTFPWTGMGARLGFGGDIAGGGTHGLRSPYYAWASVIVDGRVVATDYAPDEGWLDPSKAK